MGRIAGGTRVAVLALLGLVSCATGDTPGFSGGAISFGPGTSAESSTEGMDDDGDGSADDGLATGGGGSDSSPSSADSGGNDAPMPPGDGDTGATGNADGPGCVPSDEVCDGVDNDCDGESDEEVVGAGAACATGLDGPCADGVTACEGGQDVCVQTTTPVAELCDGVDNDCNGTADDGDPEGGAACATGLPGICASGTSACQGGAVVCLQDQQPATEGCNSLDDDCDGTADDGNPGGGGGCSTGLSGICAAGTYQCQGGVINCAQNQTAGTEICANGVDEDCDGTADDGCVNGCVGYCGGQSPEGCYCDASCAGFGDCCSNACAVCGACGPCEGSCGGQSPDGCYCDALCVSAGDCCSDACATCGFC